MDNDKLYSDMVNMYREQRHDFLNHFQVILGYLQLNKADRAVQYIKQMNMEMQQLSAVTKLENPYLVLILLQAVQKSKSRGISMSFDIEKGVSFCQAYDKEAADQLAYVIDAVFCCLNTVGKEQEWIKIAFKEMGNNICIISCPPCIVYEELIHQLQDETKGLKKRSKLQADKLPEKVRIIFRP